jgi:cyclopropane fatty-acyl-phospholipid synthase-like methyltransferase
MSDHADRVNDYFDQSFDDYRHVWGLDAHLGMHVSFYDATHRTHAAAVLNLNRVIADAAEVAGGDRVLDAGCGVGGTAFWLARHRSAEVVGVNINPRQVEYARKLATRDGLDDRVRFAVADYAATGLLAGYFDAVVAVESVCYATDRTAVAREAYRLLRPGGRLALADGFLLRDPVGPREAADLRRWCDGWAVPALSRVDRFAADLQSAGFVDVAFRDCRANVRATSRHMFALALAMWWPARILQWLGLRTAIQNGNVEAGYYQYALGRCGLATYGIFTARKPESAAA